MIGIQFNSNQIKFNWKEKNKIGGKGTFENMFMNIVLKKKLYKYTYLKKAWFSIKRIHSCICVWKMDRFDSPIFHITCLVKLTWNLAT